MACTTILVGKKASYDGSTMIARNDDSGSGHFTAKKFIVVQPEEHPAVYKSVISHVEVPLPGNALRMTAMPNAVEGKGIWAASGVNAANVGMTAPRRSPQPPRSGRRPAGGPINPPGTASRKSPAASAKRICLPRPALHPLCPRGRAPSGQAAGRVRHL